MKNVIVTLLLTGMLLAAGMLLPVSKAGLAADDQLVVTQDESSMEKVIESNLTSVHKLTVNEKYHTADDLYLELPMKVDAIPDYKIIVDTQVSHQDTKTNTVIERCVLIVLQTSVIVPPEHRVAVLETLNDLNRKKIFSCAYIDTDGEVTLDWDLNVLGTGLPVENVYDAISRVDKLWRGVYPSIVTEIQ